MKNQLVIKGLKQEQQNLLQLPNRMAMQALDVVNATAKEAAADIKAQYPRRTGNLKRSVRVERGKKTGAKRLAQAIATVVVGSPVAHLIEHGTVQRHTSWGPEHGDRGQMFGLNIFWPRILRANRELQPQYRAILRAEGLKVTGSA